MFHREKLLLLSIKLCSFLLSPSNVHHSLIRQRQTMLNSHSAPLFFLYFAHIIYAVFFLFISLQLSAVKHFPSPSSLPSFFSQHSFSFTLSFIHCFISFALVMQIVYTFYHKYIFCFSRLHGFTFKEKKSYVDCEVSEPHRLSSFLGVH